MSLYQITDKNKTVIGVHECDQEFLKGYLWSLPEQGSPYTANLLDTTEKSITTKILEHFYYQPAYLGLGYGLAVSVPAWGYLVYKTLGGH